MSGNERNGERDRAAVNSLKLPEKSRNICRRCSNVAAPLVVAVVAATADVADDDDAPSHDAVAAAAAALGVCVCVCVCVCVRVFTR